MDLIISFDEKGNPIQRRILLIQTEKDGIRGILRLEGQEHQTFSTWSPESRPSQSESQALMVEAKSKFSMIWTTWRRSRWVQTWRVERFWEDLIWDCLEFFFQIANRRREQGNTSLRDMSRERDGREGGRPRSLVTQRVTYDYPRGIRSKALSIPDKFRRTDEESIIWQQPSRIPLRYSHYWGYTLEGSLRSWSLMFMMH